MGNDILRGHLDLLLLGVLAGGPGHGYAIISLLKQQSGGTIDVPEGSIYPALHRLEDLGLLVSDWAAIAGRRRREYRLTPKGVKALAAQRREWDRLSEAVNSVLAGTPVGRPLAALSGGARA